MMQTKSGVQLIPWSVVREKMLASIPPHLRAHWHREVRKARDRYHSEIREYRGIPRLRSMYRRKRSSRW